MARTFHAPWVRAPRMRGCSENIARGFAPAGRRPAPTRIKQPARIARAGVADPRLAADDGQRSHFDALECTPCSRGLFRRVGATGRPPVASAGLEEMCVRCTARSALFTASAGTKTTGTLSMIPIFQEESAKLTPSLASRISLQCKKTWEFGNHDDCPRVRPRPQRRLRTSWTALQSSSATRIQTAAPRARFVTLSQYV